MKNKHEDLGYWAGWAVAFGIAAAVFIFVMWQIPSLKDIVCKKDETDCFRQWVTALGGWAAVIVAVPTILFLSRQISDANRYQQQNMQVQLRRTRAMAARASRNAIRVRDFAEEIIKNWQTGFIVDEDLDESLNYYAACIRNLKDLMSDSVFDFCEDEVASVSRMNLQRIRRMLDEDFFGKPANPDIKFIEELIKKETLRDVMTNYCRAVIEWTTNCANECDALLEQSAEMIGFTNTHHPANASST